VIAGGNDQVNEGRVSRFCATALLPLYPRIRTQQAQAFFRSWISKLEGGAGHSVTIRELLRKYYRLNVGLYTAGPCKVYPRVYQPTTTIGRYSAVAETVRTFTRNHTITTKSTHGFFDNPALGKVKTDLIPWGHLLIGNGVWIGENAIILPPTTTIGDGAVICAGSVVYANVPPYAVVSGFPARVVGFRFSKRVIATLLDSRWWEKTPDELAACGDYYCSLTREPRPDNGEKEPQTHNEAESCRLLTRLPMVPRTAKY
jgi:virginiamycin A acetyltransferase